MAKSTTTKKTTGTKSPAKKKTTKKTVTKKAETKPATDTKKPPIAPRRNVEGQETGNVKPDEKKVEKPKVDNKPDEKVSQIGAKHTDETKSEGAEIEFDMPKAPKIGASVTVNADNVNEIINDMPEVGSVSQAIPATATAIENEESSKPKSNSPLTSLTHITKQAISHGETILGIINGDWRKGSWGFVPIDVVHEGVSKGSKEYQYEVKETSQGAYFLLIIGEDTHRFPQDEKEFIKTA